MNDLGQDLRYAWRTLRRNPLFTVVIVLTLALGIGGNAAIFSLLDQVLVRVLSVREPERLVLLDAPGTFSGGIWRSNGVPFPVSQPMFEDLRGHESMAGIAARFPATVNVTRGEQTERARGSLVSGNFFEVLGVGAALGRVFTAGDDETPGAHPLIVLSHGYFMRRFGGESSIIGSQVGINGHPMTVIGVTQPGFRGIELGRPVDVMLPSMMLAEATPTWPALGERKMLWLQLIGRLAPGMTREGAQAALNLRYAQILEQDLELYPGKSERFRNGFLEKRIELVAGYRGLPDVQTELSTPLMVLMAMVGLVLLIACANVANLLLARASHRQREIAVRLALGAGRFRLVRQLVVESLVLSLLGGCVGLLVAVWVGGALLRALPYEGVAEALSADPDGRMVAFTFAVATLTGLVFGLVPALQGTRVALAPTLKNEAGSLAGGLGPMRLRKVLVVAQVAFSMLLLIGAGLFSRSLHNLRTLDTGFDQERVLSFSIEPTLLGYSQQQKRALYARLQEEVVALPGVTSGSFAQESLMTQSLWRNSVKVDGYEPEEGEDMAPNFNAVGTGFFDTLGMTLVAGRDFDERDTGEATKVAIVNETFARYFYGAEPAIGRRFGMGGKSQPTDVEIVGIVRDGQINTLREEVPRMAYVPYTQAPESPGVTYYLASALEPQVLSGSLRDAVRRADPNMPLFDLTTMRARIDESLFTDRIVATLSAAFGALATLLAAVGLYGVMSYAVSRRTREIGVRVALGAGRARILRLVLGEVAVLAGLGILIGLPGGWGLGRVVESQLFGLSAADPLTLGLATLVLALTATLAGLVPAHSAAKVDPATALRWE